ncbi:hypothetical protein H0H93_006025, partial [Arthromyces matolae]
MEKRDVKVVQPGLVYVIEWRAFWEGQGQGSPKGKEKEKKKYYDEDPDATEDDEDAPQYLRSHSKHMNDKDPPGEAIANETIY